jgi:Icc-related predicted phosphoesterase
MAETTFTFLVLSDIHGHGEVAWRAVKAHPGLDALIIAGDITNFGGAEDTRAVIEAIRSAVGKIAIYGVSGNCDKLSARRYLAAAGLDLEPGSPLSEEFIAAGAGGGLRRAGITSFERSEGELEAALGPSLEVAWKQAGSRPRTRPLIVVTHSPPYGTNADLHAGMHVGSKTFSRLMGRYNPDVWICGHIHESRCVSLEDGTLVINPGPCALGYHAILEIRREGEGPDPTVKASLFSL